jgi:MtN3 and saliva related transmembrane protein
MTDAIGWASSVVLLFTIITQVRKQWESESNEGVSKWLFVGQFFASLGFTTYSILTGDIVFSVTNSMLLCSSSAGLYFYFRNFRSKGGDD